MFWNVLIANKLINGAVLTVNMKCFEILKESMNLSKRFKLTVNMKCFEMVLIKFTAQHKIINRKHEM